MTGKKEIHLAWDANRPIPWRRLIKEAAIFLVVGAVAMAFLVKEQQVGNYIGLVIGMLFYVGFVAVLSKFGYQRQSIRDARERRRAMASTPAAASQPVRQRPAPTKRTSTGPSQRPNRSTKKRRR
ncbi:MAG: hypothetical protein ABI894_04525 [Ilumatobacteraceae bacterium]